MFVLVLRACHQACDGAKVAVVELSAADGTDTAASGMHRTTYNRQASDHTTLTTVQMPRVIRYSIPRQSLKIHLCNGNRETSAHNATLELENWLKRGLHHYWAHLVNGLNLDAPLTKGISAL